MLKCRMCYKWQDSTPEVYPTVPQYKKFLTEFRELVDDNFIIHFGGGETFLFEGLLDLVKFSGEKGFSTNVISNGWLINEEMAKRVADSGLNYLVLSLDSLNEQTHDYLRGVKGVYRRVMKAIEHLSRHCNDTKIGICSVIYNWNLDELMPLLEWVNSNDKISSIIFMAPMQPNSTAVEKKWWNGKFNCLWPQDALKAAAFVENLIELKKKYYKIGNQVPQLEALKHYFRHPEEFVKKTQCNLDRAVHVSAVGEVFLCYRWAILGDIRKGDDIRKIWRSETTGQVREKIAACKDNCHFLLNCFFEGDYPLGMEK